MLLTSTLIVGGFAAALVVTGLWAREAAWFLIGSAVLILVAYTWAWIRVWRVGVTIRESDVIATSWFSSRRLQRAEVNRWSSEPYTGWFFVSGWPVAGGALEAGMLAVDLADGDRQNLLWSVTWRTTTRDQARYLNDWLRSEDQSAPAESVGR